MSGMSEPRRDLYFPTSRTGMFPKGSLAIRICLVRMVVQWGNNPLSKIAGLFAAYWITPRSVLIDMDGFCFPTAVVGVSSISS